MLNAIDQHDSEPIGSPQRNAVPGLPFSHLNLRFNPFGEMDLSDRAELAIVDLEELYEPIEAGRFAVQFMGDKGRGKTTHLLSLLAYFQRQASPAYVHIPEDEQPAIPQGDPLFVDEVQRVPRRSRRRVFQKQWAGRGSIVLGTHLDVSSELRKYGFEVRTIYPGEHLDESRLHLILNRRIEWAKREQGATPGVTRETARALIGRFGDDVRAIERSMYDVFQSLTEIQNV